jgi:hypothetical protein
LKNSIHNIIIAASTLKEITNPNDFLGKTRKRHLTNFEISRKFYEKIKAKKK